MMVSIRMYPVSDDDEPNQPIDLDVSELGHIFWTEHGASVAHDEQLYAAGLDFSLWRAQRREATALAVPA